MENVYVAAENSDTFGGWGGGVCGDKVADKGSGS